MTTNIFNTYHELKDVKNICKTYKVPMIEDNAIYFGNYKLIGNKKIYSGSMGDYVLNSFNIMKNVSAMYGGSVASNDTNFASFAKKELLYYKNFPFFKYLSQSLIFLMLKILKITLIYRLFFIGLISNATKKNNRFILSFVYPSIKFKLQKFPNSYFTKISALSKKMIYLQLIDKDNFKNNHFQKRINNSYYYKILRKKNIKGIKLINFKEPSFQNFNDFPILVKKKKELVNYLFSKGIETKIIQYVDCQNIFLKKKTQNLDYYENRVLCLPNHIGIKKEYIDYIIKHLTKFYDTKFKN